MIFEICLVRLVICMSKTAKVKVKKNNIENILIYEFAG